MLNLGINSNCDCTINQNFYKTLKNLGFKDVMLSFKNGDFAENIIELRDNGFNIPYVHLSYNRGNALWVKGESFNEYVNEICNQIETCGKLNIPIVVMHASCGNPADIPLKPNKQGIIGMKKMLEIAKKYHVKIALENSDYDSLEHLKYLLNNIYDDYLGFCYDSGHHNLYCKNEDLLKFYGNRLLAVHLHDNLMDWEYGFDHSRDLHRLPFDGKINFADVGKKLAEVNYSNSIMLEVRKMMWANTPDAIYKDLTDEEFLTLAHERAKKLEEMIGRKTHVLNLNPKYFHLIKSGEKVFEGRLHDEKRQQISVGDMITFYKEPERVEFFNAMITEKLLFKSFEEMADALNKKDLGFSTSSKQEMIDIYHSFYSQENIKKYGVVVLGVEVCKS